MKGIFKSSWVLSEPVGWINQIFCLWGSRAREHYYIKTVWGIGNEFTQGKMNVKNAPSKDTSQ